MVFRWSLSDKKSPEVSRTLLSILANLNIILIWIVSIRPQNFNLFFKPLGAVPSAPIIIGIITVLLFCFNIIGSYMLFLLLLEDIQFHSLFSSLQVIVSLRFFLKIFTLWSTGES